MQYITRQNLKYAITSVQTTYALLDVRKTADYEANHIINAVSADMDAAKSNGDDAGGIANLEAALKKATGRKDGKDSTIVLLCYTGAGYAETAQRLLADMGIEQSRIYTLEGGYEGWTKDDPNGEYQYLIDAVEASQDDKPNQFTTKLFRVPRPGDNYIKPQDLKAAIDGGKIADYYMIDTRTAEEYEKSHLVTAVNMADFADPSKNVFLTRDKVAANVEATLAKHPIADGQKIVVICRGGKGGAQQMTDMLRESFEIDNARIYTLSFGFVATDQSWTKLGDEYTKYVVKGAEPGTL